MAITLAVVPRQFETVRTFHNVVVFLPDEFQAKHFIRTNKVECDGAELKDPSHFWWGVKVNGRWVNIHYYPLGKPMPRPASLKVVGEMHIVTEKIGQRAFTRLNLVETRSQVPKFTLDFSTNGERGSRILQCQVGKIVFRPIEHTRPGEQLTKAPTPASKQKLPEFMPAQNTVKLVNTFIDFFALHGVPVPSDSNKNDHTKACWLLGQLQRDYEERYKCAFQTHNGADLFMRSLKHYINKATFRPK